MDVAALADLLHETSERHGSFEAVAPPHDWWDWYAAYMDARQGGSAPDEAAAAAGRYMAEVKHVVVLAHEHHRHQPFQQRPGLRRVVAVLDALQHRPPQPRLLPGDVRPPADQHDHGDDRRRARRARRPDRAGPGPQRRRLRQRQPRLLPGPLRHRARPGQDRGAGRRPDRDARVARSPRPPVARPGGQHRLDPRTRPRRRKRVRAGLRPAVRLAREHAARPVRGRHRAWSPAAARWPGCRAWSVAAARSRSCSSPTISTDRARSSTGTSTA